MKLKMDAYTKAFEKAGTYAVLHAHYAEKFPGLGEADGTPIGALLSQMKGGELKGGLQRGDILVAFEPDPATLRPNRQVTVNGQSKDHNGLSSSVSQGDPANVHNAIYTAKDPAAQKPWGYGYSQVVEARAARDLSVGPEPINRVQPAAISATELPFAKVYRPKDPNFADAFAENAVSMAAGNIVYGTKALSLALKGHFELTPEARKTVAKIAEDGFNPVIQHFVNPVNMHDKFKEGVNCTSFVVVCGQSTQLQIAQNEQMEKKLQGSDIKVDTLETLAETHLTGAFAINADHVSVRTFEHFLLTSQDSDGSFQFECVGKIRTKPEDVLYPEALPPMKPAQSGPLPETHPHSIEYQEKLQHAKDRMSGKSRL